MLTRQQSFEYGLMNGASDLLFVGSKLRRPPASAARPSIPRQPSRANSVYAARNPENLPGGTGADMFFRIIGFALGMGACLSVAMATITALP